jgi:hypothetical protein
MYILCEFSNNKNACDRTVLHVKKKKILYTKQEDILSWQKTWIVQTRAKIITSRTAMKTAMDRIRVVRTNPPINLQTSPQTDPQTKLPTATTRSSSTENELLHNM